MITTREVLNWVLSQTLKILDNDVEISDLTY